MVYLIVILICILIIFCSIQHEPFAEWDFIHNPKTGGTSLRGPKIQASCPEINFLGHTTTNNKPNEIAVVRDPKSRFVSAVDYMRKGGHLNNLNCTQWQPETAQYKCCKLLNHAKTWSEVMNSHKNQFINTCLKDQVFKEQSAYLSDRGNIICYDDRLATLEKDLKTKFGCSQDLKIPVTNTASPNSAFWNSAIGIDEFVRARYRKDQIIYDNYCQSGTP